MKTIDKLLRDTILDATRYRTVEPHSKELSASELSNDPMKIWLKQKYGVIEDNKIGHNTIGSILHLGIEHLIKDKIINNQDCNINARTEVELTPADYKDYKLTGTADLIIQENNKATIIDYKLIHEYSEKMLLKDIQTGKDNNYILQLNIYRFLYYFETGIDADIYIASFSRGKGVDRKNNRFIEPFTLIEIPKISFAKITKAFENAVNMLIRDNKEETHKCDKKQFGVTAGKPTKCEFYCSYKSVCQLYEKNEYRDRINF